MDLGLRDRPTVVLASSAGLGLAVARELLEEGALVCISGRSRERLEAALAGLRVQYGERVHGETLDVRVGEDIERHLEGVCARWGAVHVLVTNAGGPSPGPASSVTSAGLSEAMELTLDSAVRAVNCVLPGMRAQGWGRIVALTSLSVREPIPDLVYSNVMRAGLTAYLKTLAAEVACDGVLVNSVCTGLFDTERLEQLFRARAEVSGRTPAEERARAQALLPAGRLGRPEELASAVAFLCSERASYVAGSALAVDGGAARGLI